MREYGQDFAVWQRTVDVERVVFFLENMDLVLLVTTSETTA